MLDVWRLNSAGRRGAGGVGRPGAGQRRTSSQQAMVSWALTIAHDPWVRDRRAAAARQDADVLRDSIAPGLLRYVNAGFVPDDAGLTIEKRPLESGN